MFNLINKGSRFSFYLLLFLSLPIIINANFILNIWLKDVPPYTVAFSQLTLVAMLISSISRPLITAQNATGNVRNYQVVVGGIELLNLPISYICLHIGMLPTSVVLVSIFVNIIALGARLIMLPYTLKGFKPSIFIKDVVIRCLMVSVIASIVPFALYRTQSNELFSFILSIVICFLFSLLAVFYVGCSKVERTVVVNQIKKRLKK